MRCSSLVMPASSPVLAWRLLLSVLMSVDLPTLGTPQISTRMGLAMPPRLGDSRWHAPISLRVGAGPAGGQHLDHHVNVLDAFGDGFTGQVHVTGEPLDGHAGVLSGVFNTV